MQRVIQELAQRFGAPVFAPHVTLYSGPLDQRDDLPKVLRDLAQRFAPMELAVTGLAHSSQFTRTFFMEFASHPALNDLSDAARDAMTQREAYNLRPHLSLLYADLPPDEREKLHCAVPGAIHFDAITAIISAGDTQSRADVERWDVLSGERLVGVRAGR